jgi:hypothetical protein
MKSMLPLGLDNDINSYRQLELQDALQNTLTPEIVFHEVYQLIEGILC